MNTTSIFSYFPFFLLAFKLTIAPTDGAVAISFFDSNLLVLFPPFSAGVQVNDRPDGAVAISFPESYGRGHFKSFAIPQFLFTKTT
ncbi:hypothetical protein F7734_57400 [Scytonema sp. UIC 10036]|uniref:hypothetical protein n=1 Tax=Scytonema sp. UIC 10036 TaxID=2304196 RepID=UPI0012DA916E|nr:hypothetical protein [Scytonema sp. UIC 10036]MUH01348.1 hypothetical protein [Scytonema sp. UIC 10036]